MASPEKTPCGSKGTLEDDAYGHGKAGDQKTADKKAKEHADTNANNVIDADLLAACDDSGEQGKGCHAIEQSRDVGDPEIVDRWQSSDGQHNARAKVHYVCKYECWWRGR